ncbi:MAG: type II secretion system F family protein, partial [Synechococcaceae bacterium WB9_4xC_028]|nr:type II secretion system F family protein [Synechococcaceae bacterium WB9_4xC_028]
MATFTASYTSASGQARSVTIRASDPADARRQLRRRGIKATDLRAKTKDQTAAGSQTKAGLLSLDLGEAFQKPPGVKEKAVWAS